MELMRQVENSNSIGTENVAQSKDVLARVRENITGLRDSFNHLTTILEGFTRVAQHSASVEKAMSDLTTQASLIKLNAAIDATSAHADGDNYARLVDETRKIVESLTAVAQESGSTLAMSDEKIAGFISEMQARRADVAAELEGIAKAFGLLDSISDRTAQASSGFAQVSSHVTALNEILGGVDGRVTAFAETLRGAESRFDKLSSDANITLMKFNELGSKIDAIETNLKQLEDFHRLFEIA
jgi:chromosome segregation ATPase